MASGDENGSNQIGIKKEITEFCPSGVTAQSTSMRMPEMVAPRLSFTDSRLFLASPNLDADI